MLIETFGDGDSPCHTTIYRRFQALDIKRNDGVFTVTGDGTDRFYSGGVLSGIHNTCRVRIAVGDEE